MRPSVDFVQERVFACGYRERKGRSSCWQFSPS